MSGVEWADPPPSNLGGRPRIITPEIVADLKADPGRWAVVARKSVNPSLGHQFCKRHPGFECTTRTAGRDDKDRRLHDHYLRYVGDA